MSFAALLETLNSVIWSPALVFLCLVVGVYFTLTTLFLQVRCLPDMMRQIVSNKK
ncbi:MAG: sodium:alanine symporter, partial [Corynebacterium matruchotii]